MYTFGLGKPVYSFWLGVAYAALEPVEEVEYGGRRSAANNLRLISNAELEALQERPDLLRSLQQKEDDEIIEFIVTFITRGLQ